MLLIVRWFKYKKDLKTAIGAADTQAILYFLFQVLYAVFHAYIKHDKLEDFNIFIWILVVFPLAIIVRVLYYKFQGIDLTKPDYEGKL